MRRMATRTLKAAVIKLLKELDGMALTYELDKLAILYGEEELQEAVDELIEARWIYIVRGRE